MVEKIPASEEAGYKDAPCGMQKRWFI